MGYTPWNVGLLYFGECMLLFEAYKKLYNFEKQKLIYKLDAGSREIARLSDL